MTHANEYRENTSYFDLSQIENELFKQYLSNDFELFQGDNILDVYVNGEYIGSHSFIVRDFEINKKSICFDLKWLESNRALSGINYQEYYVQYYNEKYDCYYLALETHTQLQIDAHHAQIKLNIPQAYFKKDEEITDYDFGINAVRMSYHGSIYDGFKGGLDYFGDADFTINYNKWVASLKVSMDKNSMYFSSASAYQAIPSIQSYLSIGQLQSTSEMNNSFSFLGLDLSSSESMKNSSWVGYSPIISGNLDSSSVIKVFQNGVLLLQDKYPSGPYVITNLRPVSTGDIEVVIYDEQGGRRTELYPVTIIPELMRPNSSDYSISLGYKQSSLSLENINVKDEPLFLSAGYYQGSDYITWGSEILLSDGYFSGGLSFSSQFGSVGAVSTFINHSIYVDENKNKNKNKKRGNSFNIKYSRSLGDVTNLQLLSYYYKDEDYLSFSDYGYLLNKYDKPKSRYEGRVSSRILESNISASLWNESYWGQEYNKQGVTISSSMKIYDVQTSVNASYYEDNIGDSFLLTVNLGLTNDNGNQMYNLSSSFSEDRISRTVSASFVDGDRNSTNLSYFDNEYTKRFSMRHQARNNITNYSLSTYYEDHGNGESDYHFSGSVRGNVYWTEKTGVGLSSTNQETLAVIEVEDLPNVRIKRTITNKNGIALVSLQPYATNRIDLDYRNIETDVDLSDSSFESKPVRGAVVYKKSSVTPVYNYYINIVGENGILKNGAKAIDSKGKQIGYGNGNLIIITAKELNQVVYIEGALGENCKINMTQLKVNIDKIQNARCIN
ncbi:fimbria/pilus outer membrane usher protein [Vibrio sp. Hep-1b-8]|uniref:fimbria/pilus outer membrane usher protein n=1 Tax=Vibrio sp. Hep-1b-8 TaxID=2144187 RepID=UPI00111021CE|nr:fimbria/pilus outer membrane usher protein [Vibrio sp. Hep-1b-8]